MKRFLSWTGVFILLCCTIGCGGSRNDRNTARENRPITPIRYAVTDLGRSSLDFSILAFNNRQEILGKDVQGRAVLLQGDVTVVLSEDPKVEAYGLNDRGQIVGQMPAGDSQQRHAFLWENGTFTDLGTLGGSNSMAWDINNRGEIVGRSEVRETAAGDSPAYRAFLYRDGRMMTLGDLGLPDNFGYRINENGQVLGGGYVTGSERQPYFVWQDGQGEVLRASDGSPLAARDINDAGVVSAMTDSATLGHHAVLLQTPGNEIIDITERGGEPLFTAPGDINNQGQVLGNSGIGTGGGVNMGNVAIYRYLYSEGKTYDLQNMIGADSGWELSSADFINDNGYILAHGRPKGEDPVRLLLLTPVYE